MDNAIFFLYAVDITEQVKQHDCGKSRLGLRCCRANLNLILEIFSQKLRVVLLLISLCLPGISMACSCAYAGKFVEYALDGKGVVRAKIKNYGPRLSHGKTLYESMTVEVTQVVKGNYKAAELTLLGDPGHLCRAYVDSQRFEIGSEHFFAILDDDSRQALGGCGESSVIIKDDLVEGRELTDKGFKLYTLKVSELVEALKEQ